MRLLLDTHVLLWWLSGDGKLGRRARARIGDVSTDVFVSAASAWEIAIKRGAGKLHAPWDVRAELAEEGFHELPVGFEHASASAELPRHHADPFDRMLVAQAREEGLWIVTSDEAIRRYDVPALDASL